MIKHAKHGQDFLVEAKRLRRKFAEKMHNNPNNPKWKPRFEEYDRIVRELKEGF